MKNSSISLDAQKAQSFLYDLPQFCPTPLHQLQVGNQSFLLKDERNRMKLGAFKAVGGIYALGNLLAHELGVKANVQTLLHKDMQARAKNITFICASAGNHGIAVARGAQLFGAKAIIVLASTVPKIFANRLDGLGAQVVWAKGDYEQSVAHAVELAQTNNYIHLADGSWPGYTEPPRLVMEGYGVLATEMETQFLQSNSFPSHVYIQAGIGGLAAGLAFQIRKSWHHQPKIFVVEPETADCLRQSHIKSSLTTVSGPVSNMGRLDCKTPSLLAFDILQRTADAFVAIRDEEATMAVQQLAASFDISTTPSGAAGFAAMLNNSEKQNRPLVIVTEDALQ